MTYICSSFLFVSNQFFGLEDRTTAYLLGAALTLLLALIFGKKLINHAKTAL